MWPLLKNSTRMRYDYHLDTSILPKWGSTKLTKLRTIELQDFFNSFLLGWPPKRFATCTAVCGQQSIRGKRGSWFARIPRKAFGYRARKHESLLLCSQNKIYAV
jgi:hypothetical protein